MNYNPLQFFVRIVQEVEYALPGSQFSLSVKYREDDSVYLGWPLPRGEYITDSGLKDPGFGSGPVEFAKIEFVTVHAKPMRGEATNDYEQKMYALRSRLPSLEQVVCDQNGITFKNS